MAAIVVAFEPDPFSSRANGPSVVHAAASPISPATATTAPPGTLVAPVVTTLLPAPPTTIPPAITSPVEVVPSAPAPTPAPVPEVPTPPTPAPTTSPAPIPPPASVAVARVAQINIWNDRADRHAAFALLGTSEFGGPRVFLASELAGDWVRVVLPLRPNGSQGWVRAADVEIIAVHDRVDVSLEHRSLRWTRAGQILLETTVGVGAAGTPTPPGDFYVTDLVREDPSGPYGAWALALNGYSEALTTFAGGDPRLAIHGTNAPSSVGRAASNGCIRVGAADLANLAAGVPLGTPVTIR